jgi:hypothetical protein
MTTKKVKDPMALSLQDLTATQTGKMLGLCFILIGVCAVAIPVFISGKREIMYGTSLVVGSGMAGFAAGVVYTRVMASKRKGAATGQTGPTGQGGGGTGTDAQKPAAATQVKPTAKVPQQGFTQPPVRK